MAVAKALVLGCAMAALVWSDGALALTREQEMCLQNAASEDQHRAWSEEVLANSPSDKAFSAMFALASQCAKATAVPEALHEKYVSFLLNNSLRVTLYDRLAAKGYPVEELGMAIQTAMRESEDGGETILTPDGQLSLPFVERVAGVMGALGLELLPDDEAARKELIAYLLALGFIITLYQPLYGG